jgi:hypothetical protein
MGNDLPSRSIGSKFGVDRQHNALAPDRVSGCCQHFWILDSGSVHADLVSAALKQSPYVVDGPDTASDSQRNENALSGCTHHIKNRSSALMGSGDIQESELISPFPVVYRGHLDGIPGVTQIHKSDAFDHPASVHVKAGNDSLGDTHRKVSSRIIALPELLQPM